MFITLEGIEGCGKSTQAGKLADFLHHQGRRTLLTREPGGTAIGNALRALLLTPDHSEIVPLCELLLYAASRAQHVSEKIEPALVQGTIVICDRFSDATLAYQGYGRGLAHATICQLNHLAEQGRKPDYTILLDCPVATGLARVRARTENSGQQSDRLEKESVAFHERVRQGYLHCAQKAPERFFVIDAMLTPEVIHQKIIAFLSERL